MPTIRKLSAIAPPPLMPGIDRALRDEHSVVTRRFRQELFVHRSCVPLDVIDFTTLQPNTIDPMATGECQGMCGL
jgi:hypothetical protein